MYIFLEVIEFIIYLTLRLTQYIFFGIVFLIGSLIFRVNYFELMKDFFFDCFSHGIRKSKNFLIREKNYIILEKELNSIINLLKEYGGKKEVKKRIYYNILYASKFLGFFYTYIGFSRRKLFKIKTNIFVEAVSENYILSSSQILFNIIKNKDINDESKFYFFKLVLNFSIHDYSKKEIFCDILFKEIIEKIINNKHQVNIQEEITILEYITDEYKKRKYLNINLLNHLFETICCVLFLKSDKLNDNIQQEIMLKILNFYEDDRLKINTLINYLNETIISSVNNSNDNFNENYINTIKNVLIVLKKINKNLTFEFNLKNISEKDTYRDLKFKKIYHQVFKEILFFKLEEKLKVKETEEKIKKI